MSLSDHAYLAPSSAARTVQCPGSVGMAALFPQEDTIESREGTAAHWACAELLAGRDVALGQVADNGVTLNDEMIEAAEMYAGHIMARGAVGSVETRIHNSALHHSENGGTPDHFAYSMNGPRLHIHLDDFKFGHGYVSVFENWQLFNYLALILCAIQDTWTDDRMIDVTFTIIQPRCYHRDGPIRSWSFCASDARPFFNILRNHFALAMRADAPCIAGDECEHCPGRHGCEAAVIAAFNGVTHAYSSVPLEMSPQAIGLELRTLKRAARRLDARITGLEEQAQRLSGRNPIPFFKIDYGSGRTSWNVDADSVVSVGQMFGVDFAKPGTLTPIQALAAMKKAGLPAELSEVIKQYTTTPTGAAKLVEDDGRGAALVFK